MKKILCLLVVTMIALSGWSQKYQLNSTNFDFASGVSVGRFFSFPTGNGSPANPIALDSALKKAAIYFDSTNRKTWIYSPKTKLWDTLQMGAASSTGWSLPGNSGTTPGTHFVGTTDSVPIMFKTQNYIAGLIGLQTSYSGSSVVWNGASPAGTTFGQTFMGKFAGESWGLTVNSNATVYGHGAMRRATTAGFGGITPQMTVIGNNAGFYTYSSNDVNGNRSVLIGQMAAYRNFKGANNTYVGTYAGELNNNGYSNTAIGRDAMRSNIDGFNNVAVGLFSLLYNSTGIISIPVSAGGSGYTFATVSISAPLGGSPGGFVTTATATATVSAGAVTAINIVNPGAGYTNDPHTYDFGTQGAIIVTISGDGTGATAGTPVLQSGTGNVSLGVLSHFGNTLGQYNTAVGYNAGSSRGWDDNTFFVGRNAGVDASVTNSYATRLTNAGAIGYNAKVAASNSLVLGGTGADQVNVGIGIITPASLLHVNGVAQIGTAGSTLGQLLMSGNTSGTVTLKTAAAAGTWSLTLPTTDGDANQVLTTDGAGVTSWTTPSGGWGTTGTVATLTGASTLAMGGNTFNFSNGQTIFSTSGAASTAAISITGNPYTAGTATTNHPLHYLNGGTAPTTWSTAGTYTGINAVSGFTGNLLDYHVNGGASVAKVDYEGTATFNGVSIGKYGGEKGFEITGGQDMYFVTNGDLLRFQGNNFYMQLQLAGAGAYTQASVVYGGNSAYVNMGTNLSIFGSAGETRLGAAGTENYVTIQTDGDVGIGQTSPAAKLDILKTTEQLRISYDGSNYVSNTVSSAGVLTIAPTGASITVTKPLVLKNYTVATLPAGVQGMICYVTDATAPTYGATLVGGGAVVTIAFYDGTNWTAH